MRVNRGGASELALVRAYADFPTYNLESEAGCTFHCGTFQCQPATPEEELLYWRRRAARAEALAARLAPEPEADVMGEGLEAVIEAWARNRRA